MRSRVGISLIECLVSLVIFSLGVTGASLTMVTAIRLNQIARHRQGVLRVAQIELLRFTATPCPVRDSAWTRVTGDWLVGRWAIVVLDSTAVMRGEVFDSAAPASPAFPMEAERRCE